MIIPTEPTIRRLLRIIKIVYFLKMESPFLGALGEPFVAGNKYLYFWWGFQGSSLDLCYAGKGALCMLNFSCVWGLRFGLGVLFLCGSFGV